MIKEIKRRILMLAGISRVTTQNDAGSVQTLQIQAPMEIKNDTLRFAEFGFSSGLPSGTDVIVLSLGGDRSSQVVIASNHNGLRFQNLKSGEVVIYNEWGQFIKLSEDKIEIEASDKEVIVNNASDVTVQASGKVTIDAPETNITGNLTVTGMTSTSGLSVGSESEAGTAIFRGDIEHIEGSIISLGRRIDGSHVHPYEEGSGTTQEPNP